VLVLDTSRIARRRLIAMMFESDCTKRGVAVVYNNLPDHDPATDMVLRSVLQAFDEYHSLISRAKGLAGMAENVRQGWRAGGRAPRGYRLEHVPTGAVRDGEPVTKSRLVLDAELAPKVRAYLQLRAAGVPRAPAIIRASAPWPPTSTHAMDWQALTYAGHTVWGVEADTPAGTKRKPRSEWLIQRGTHDALITDAEADAILVQMERGLQGRLLRASPLLLTGVLRAPDGEPWHSDGCGFYRHGKRGRRIGAALVEGAILWRLQADLMAEDTAQRLLAEMQRQVSGEHIDGRQILGLERRAAKLATEISRTVGLASRMDDPDPVLRRVADLEAQRAAVVRELDALRQQQREHASAGALTVETVRDLLRRLFVELRGHIDDARRDEARAMLAQLVERIDLDPATRTARLHYALATGDGMATPSLGQRSPVQRWSGEVVDLQVWRKAA
jgi:site-specific DNA recombinase